MSGRKRSLSGPACFTPQKKKKYKCSYQDSWEKEFQWVKPSDRGASDAFCILCKSHISISSGAKNDLMRHAKTASHLAYEKSSAGSKNISLFMSNAKTKLQDKIINAETLFANSVAEHNLAMNLYHLLAF